AVPRAGGPAALARAGAHRGAGRGDGGARDRSGARRTDLRLLARQDPHLRADDRRVPAGRGRRLVAGPGPGSTGADLARGGAPHRLRDRLHHQGAAGPHPRTSGRWTTTAAMTRARGTRNGPRRVITSSLHSALPAPVPRESGNDTPCGSGRPWAPRVRPVTSSPHRPAVPGTGRAG